MNIDTEQRRQVEVLSRYLLGTSTNAEWIYTIYAESCQHNTPTEKVVALAFRHPRLLPFLDGGLIFIRPNSELRRRIHIIFAALESTPEHAAQFLPQKVSFVQLLALIGVGIRGVFRALIGIIIIKVGRL